MISPQGVLIVQVAILDIDAIGRACNLEPGGMAEDFDTFSLDIVRRLDIEPDIVSHGSVHQQLRKVVCCDYCT